METGSPNCSSNKKEVDTAPNSSLHSQQEKTVASNWRSQLWASINSGRRNSSSSIAANAADSVVSDHVNNIRQHTEEQWQKLSDKIKEFRQKARQNFPQGTEMLKQWGQKTMDMLERRLRKWRAGWGRVYNVFSDPISMERVLTERVALFTALLGMFAGGLPTLPETKRRFELYQIDKNFGALAFQRQMDYTLTRFFIRGAKHAIPLSFAMSSVCVLTLATTAYRDRYTLWYFPLSAYLVFVTKSFYKGLGVYSLLASMYAVMVPTFFLTGATLAACWWKEAGSVDQLYRMVSEQDRAEREQKAAYYARLQNYMSVHGGIYMGWGSRARRNMDKAIAEGRWHGEITEWDDWTKEGELDAKKGGRSHKETGDDFADEVEKAKENETRQQLEQGLAVEQQKQRRERLQR